jgi:DNA-binding NtrC family response regulator
MDHNLSLIKALVETLHIEIDTLKPEPEELDGEPIDLCARVREYEAKMIRAALIKTGGNQRKAASLLNLKTTTLNTKIKHYGIRLIKHGQNGGAEFA